MCGIAGYLSSKNLDADYRETIAAMTDALVHRGPNDRGFWADENAGICLGHRRLSIIDLTDAGHQPMASECGRYVISYNGEIYNFEALRDELNAQYNIAWKGYSDTEVLLRAISFWGFEETLPKLNGMFAFAVWDKEQRQLFLARDRFGEKPLFYGSFGNEFLFGSELKSLREHPSFRAEIDRGSLALYLRHNYIPAPHTIYQGVHKLPPASWVMIDRQGTVSEPRPYWSLHDVARHGSVHPRTDSDRFVDDLEMVLSEAVRLRMRADVQLGAFLSGGVDSSLIVALMQMQSPRPIKTFTIGFSERDYNEAEIAKSVARHLGTEHHELYLDPSEALNFIPSLPDVWDEPFADSSQIPTFLVSKMAKEHVTVSLSGDGGDELFGGYTRYLLANRIWGASRSVPKGLRKGIASLLRHPGVAHLASVLSEALPSGIRPKGIRDRLPKVADVLDARDAWSVYRSLISHFDDPSRLVLDGNEPKTFLSTHADWNLGLTGDMMYADTMTYLPDDILTKVDRASMSVSLESRIPFLDPSVAAFAWSLPESAKISKAGGKQVLRELLYRHVPRSIIDRPKMGFGIPIGDWLRGPLRSWADQLIDPSRLHAEGYFAVEPIIRMWDQHKSGERDWQYKLWSVLMFQAWNERQMQRT